MRRARLWRALGSWPLVVFRLRFFLARGAFGEEARGGGERLGERACASA